MSVAIRPARHDDVDFLVALGADEDIAPFLAPTRPTDPADFAEAIDRSEREPDAFGVFLIEVDGARAGAVTYERINQRSAIARLSGLAVHPEFRGRGIADEAARLVQRHLLFDLGFHRLELEVYGFNERALRHAVRAGFTREGTRRHAYLRGDEWVTGILFGLVREDLEGQRDAERLACRQVTVHVSALEPAVAFYVGVLGLELLERGDSFFAVRAGDVRVSVFSGFERAPGERARQTGVTLMLETHDVEEAFRTVCDRGGEPIGGIAQAGEFLRFFSLLDPDGTLVSVAQYEIDELLRPEP